MKRVVAVVASLGLLAGCAEEPAGDTLPVGVIISLTGSYGSLGSERLQGVALALEEINAQGGVLGSRLEMVSRDDGTDPSRARQAAQELVNDAKVSAIIGPSASGPFLAASEVTIPSQVLQVSGSATSPRITALADEGFANRTCPPDSLQGRVIARRAWDAGFRHMAVVHGEDAYTAGLAAAFVSAYTGLGGGLTTDKTIAVGQTSYVNELTELYGTAPAPEAIVLVAYNPEGVQMLKDYNRSFSGEGTFWYFTDSLAEQDFVTGVGGQSFSFQHEGTGPASPAGPRAIAFNAAYRAKYGKDPEPTSFAANYYDATYMVALSMQAAGEARGALLRDQLPLVSKGGTPYAAAEFVAARDAVAAGGDIDFEGVSGLVDLDAHGDPVAPYNIWHVANSQIQVIDTVDP